MSIAAALSASVFGCAAGQVTAGADANPSAPDGGAVDPRAPDGGVVDPSAPDGGGGGGGGDGGGGGTVAAVEVRLVPQTGVSGVTRINFAVPLPPDLLYDAEQVRVVAAGTEVPAARRGLASYADGSLRSVQIQIDLDVAGEQSIDVELGATPAAGSLARVAVADTLQSPDGTTGPRVWALLEAHWLSDSRVAGPEIPEQDVAGTVFDAWARICDYASWDTDAFLAQSGDPGPWLYDRATAMYRGYARRGDLVPLRSAYREASIYRNGLTGTGAATRIGVPGKANDLKYYYTQGLALHYLLTGDDRFRESAEDVATRVEDLWSSPGYAGGTDFWTERHAGFGLLAWVWAAIVSDDRADEFRALADDAVAAYLDVQASYPIGYTDTAARCFAHDAAAHDESYGYWGCSPWMSAILADALDAYATETGGAPAAQARHSIVELGRILARDGLDGSGKPYYWMGVGTTSDEVDVYDEHWGETAYIIGMAWYYDGRTDDELRDTALAVAAGLDADGEVGQIRSFNWQCRSAVATAWYLQ